jgi:protein required for attachment to host cells
MTAMNWVLIADGARARILGAEWHGRDLRVHELQSFQGDHRPNRELMDDKPSRVYESVGATRHAVEPKSDPHRQLKQKFAAVLSRALAASLEKKMFESLIIVAPAVTMGDLRSVLTDPVKDKVIAEVVLDLTKVPDSEVARNIEDVVPRG